MFIQFDLIVNKHCLLIEAMMHLKKKTCIIVLSGNTRLTESKQLIMGTELTMHVSDGEIRLIWNRWILNNRVFSFFTRVQEYIG